MLRIGGICISWNVVAGLAVVGLVLSLVAPNLVWSALPLLLVVACPLSMLFMVRGSMQGRPRASQPEQASQPIATGLMRDQQLAALKAQLSSVQTQHDAIARAIAQLESEGIPAVREAEAVARAAEERTRDSS